MPSRTTVRLVVVLALALHAGGAAGQPARTIGELFASVPALASMPLGATAAELTIRWFVTPAVVGDLVRPGDVVPVNQLQIVGRGAVHGPLTRERDPQWSSDELVVVILDAAGRETSWQKVRDPRLLRVELPGPTGELRGSVLHRAVAELVVTVPDMASAATLRVYEATATGAQLGMRQLAQLTLSR